MKAAVNYQAGGPEVFRYQDVPDPVPGPDGVLVRVEAISVEGGDTLHRASGEAGRTSSATRRRPPLWPRAAGSPGSGRASGS